MHSPLLQNEDRIEASTPTCDDPFQSLKEMFVDLVMGRRIARGPSPVMRPVFLKQYGIAFGYFERNPEIAEALKIGVFAHDRVPLVARFSSDIPPSRPDHKSTLGVAIKLLGVPGTKLLHEDASTCDVRREMAAARAMVGTTLILKTFPETGNTSTPLKQVACFGIGS